MKSHFQVHMGDTQAGPSIVVAEEGGSFVFYDRARMSCDSVNRFPSQPKEAAEGDDLTVQPLEWEETQQELGADVEELLEARILPQRPRAVSADVGTAEEEEEEEKVGGLGLGGSGGGEHDMGSFLAGAALAPVAVALMALRPYVARTFLRNAKKHNPMLSV